MAQPALSLLLGFLLMGMTASRASEAQFDPTAVTEPGEELSGGETTVFDASAKAFSFPAKNLAEEHHAPFFVGRSFFNENWVAAPGSTAGRDGLGPLFNTRSCSACHLSDGRSRPPEPGQPMVTMLMRISVPGRGPHLGAVPDPTYGDQIQGQGILGVPREADVVARYEEQPGRFADGEKFSLRKPTYSFEHLGYGSLADGLMMSPRVAPAIVGLGLLEAIPEATLRALAEEQERAGAGVKGRINYVWDSVNNKRVPGRFGWKAEQPTVFHQTAGAFLGDMGITSSVNQEENYTEHEEICRKQPNGGRPEVSDQILQAVASYSRTLAVPARRDWTNASVRLGERMFAQVGCAACHVPKLRTGDWPEFPELSQQTIRPYTDLLLHDLGEGLADHRPVFEAGGRDWRTPPLWGIGLVEKVNGHTFLLHDGRARNLSEAILWHGGEAAAAREQFRALAKNEREALLTFLRSL